MREEVRGEVREGPGVRVDGREKKESKTTQCCVHIQYQLPLRRCQLPTLLEILLLNSTRGNRSSPSAPTPSNAILSGSSFFPKASVLARASYSTVMLSFSFTMKRASVVSPS